MKSQYVPHFVMMIGMPGSGKSTYIKKKYDDYMLISTDNEIEQMAAALGKTYNEIFSDKVFKEAEARMNKKLQEALAASRDIVWDQTNLNAKSRKKKLDLIGENYYKIAVVFHLSEGELKKRQEKREHENGKTVPKAVLENMHRSFELPSKKEGFDALVTINDYSETCEHI